MVSALSVVAVPARADALGSLIPLDGETLSPYVAARALIADRADGSAQHFYETAFAFEGVLPSFVWVVPVPAGATATFGGCEALDAVAALSEPLVLIQHRQPQDGCSCDEWSIGEAEGSPIGAHEWEEGGRVTGLEGNAEHFDSTEELEVRLGELGLTGEVPGLAWEVLGFYVANGNDLVLVRVNPSAQEGSVCVQFQYSLPPDGRYLVPLRSARVGASVAPRMEFTVYVLDENRAEPTDGSPYPSTEVDRESIRLSGRDTTNYADLFGAAVGFDEPDGTARSFVVEYSGVVDFVEPTVGHPDARWLTRLRTSLQPGELGLDLPLGQVEDGAALGRTHTILVASRARSVPGAAGALGALALAACLVAARRRPRRRR